MSPPPPRPDDEQPPPAAGWEVVESPRDPILNDPLFAELVESKPLPDLSAEPPVAEPLDDLPMAEVAPVPRATPVERPRPRPVVPPPPRRAEEPTEPPKPQVFAACAVMGCFGLGFLAAMGFIGWAALTFLAGIPDDRPTVSGTAAARPGPVAPTQMTEQKREIPLPGRVHAVGRAAGGRYLLLHVQQTQQILVFDPNTGNLLNHRFECGTGPRFAGSASKLFVYRTAEAGEQLQRWDLTTGVREKTAAKPTDVPDPSALVAGAGVDGPVYLVSTPMNAGGHIRALDPDTLSSVDSITATSWRAATYTHVRATDDGTLWGATTQGGALLVRLPQLPAKGHALFLTLPRGATSTPQLATPAPDGKLAYTTVGVVDTGPNPPKKRGNRSLYSFPTAHGSGLFLTVRDPVTQALTGPLRLHVAADPDVGLSVPGVEVPRGLMGSDIGYLPPDQRIHLWPAAGIAVTIPTPMGAAGKPELPTLEVHRVDVPALLKEREDPYLVIGSEPQLWAVRGREWRYRPTVWTNEAEAHTLTKPAGPPGMSVQNGDLVWTPGPTDTRVDVTLGVMAGNSLSAEQRFRLTVVDDADGAGH
ncbi:MAG TPA: hypothetical protein VD866_23510 [Urbifossiella sp.]|nr:hypothetical protein [Urbifossiella sp.]